jgi:CRP-like cAMP-binding protein
MQQSMFDILLALPLFQGLGHADLTRILESTHLEFVTIGPGGTACQQDATCDRIIFVIEGKLAAHTLSADRQWGVIEHLSQPAIVGLDVLHGRRRTFTFTATALTRTKLLVVDKRTMGALFRYFEVMQINALNHLTSELARRDAPLWLPATTSLEARILHFCRLHLLRPAGYKCFDISQRALGDYLGEDPRYISKALQRMENDGLLKRSRRSIEFPAFEKALSQAYHTAST